MPISERLGAWVTPSYYEIRVTGVLPPEALLDFERLTASVEPVETVVHGPLADQAALQGLLARLETLGVQVLEVRRMRSEARPAPPQPSAGPGLHGLPAQDAGQTEHGRRAQDARQARPGAPPRPGREVRCAG